MTSATNETDEKPDTVLESPAQKKRGRPQADQQRVTLTVPREIFNGMQARKEEVDWSSVASFAIGMVLGMDMSHRYPGAKEYFRWLKEQDDTK